MFMQNSGFKIKSQKQSLETRTTACDWVGYSPKNILGATARAEKKD
jgi:hypothetical protein